MPEYMRDCEGDVWERDDRWRYGGVEPRTTEELEADYGPLTRVDADGEPKGSGTPDVNSGTADVRALVAAAFDDLAGRMSAFPPFQHAQAVDAAVTSQVAGWVGSWAADTAAGLRT